jgi:hypothetical protein
MNARGSLFFHGNIPFLDAIKNLFQILTIRVKILLISYPAVNDIPLYSSSVGSKMLIFKVRSNELTFLSLTLFRKKFLYIVLKLETDS